MEHTCPLCFTPTETKYNELKKILDEFTELLFEIKPVLEFYNVRKYPLFNAISRFGYSGVTTAERRVAQIKCSTQLLLLDVARDGITTMINQCSNLHKYKEQSKDITSDKAPNEVK